MILRYIERACILVSRVIECILGLGKIKNCILGSCERKRIDKMLTLKDWTENEDGSYKAFLSDGRILDNLNLNQLRSLSVCQVLHGCIDVPERRKADEMIIQIDLKENELATLIHILDERIRMAQDLGISDDDSSSMFRKNLIDKLIEARKQFPKQEPVYVKWNELENNK